MPKFSLFLAAAVLAVSSGSVFAQVGSLADGTLSVGQKVDQAPQGTSADATSVIHGDWDLQCAKEGPEPRPCRMYQLMKDQNGQPLSEVTLFKLPTPDGTAVAGATIIVPLETLLPAQLTLTVDGQNAQRYPFAFCNQVGCISRIGLTEEDVTALKAGTQASIVIVPAAAPDQIVSVTMSLNGFTTAYDKAVPVPN